MYDDEEGDGRTPWTDSAYWPDYIGSVDEKKSACKKCGRPIVWGVTKKNGKYIPMDPLVGGGGQLKSHFETCPEKT